MPPACLRSILTFHICLQVFGCVLIGVGAWTLIEYGDYVTLTDSVPNATASKVMIAAGVLIAIISFLGCCGAWKENRCMLVIVSLDFCPQYSTVSIFTKVNILGQFLATKILWRFLLCSHDLTRLAKISSIKISRS